MVSASAEDQRTACSDAGGDAQPLPSRTKCDPAARTGRGASKYGFYWVAAAGAACGAVGVSRDQQARRDWLRPIRRLPPLERWAIGDGPSGIFHFLERLIDLSFFASCFLNP